MTDEPGTTPVVRFSRWNLLGMHIWLLPYLSAIILVVATYPPTPFEWGVAVFLTLLGLFGPPVVFWFGGMARSLDGSELTVRTALFTRRAIDLTTVTHAVCGGAPTMGHGQWLVLAHPEGHRVRHRLSLSRLSIPGPEVGPLFAEAKRFTVIPITVGHSLELLQALTRIMPANGGKVSSSVRTSISNGLAFKSLPKWRQF